MALNLNEKPQIFGFEVTDFYILIAVEAIILFIALYLAKYSIIIAGIFFAILGGGIFSFLSFKKLLPEYFFTNIFKYLTGPKIYVTKNEVDYTSSLFKKIFPNAEEEIKEQVDESKAENRNN